MESKIKPKGMHGCVSSTAVVSEISDEKSHEPDDNRSNYSKLQENPTFIPGELL